MNKFAEKFVSKRERVIKKTQVCQNQPVKIAALRRTGSLESKFSRFINGIIILYNRTKISEIHFPVFAFWRDVVNGGMR